VPVPAAPPISPSDARITLTLNQIPLGEALRYIASQAGLKVKVEPYAISIIPINEQSSDLFTKEYRVPPGFVSSAVNSVQILSIALPQELGEVREPAKTHRNPPEASSWLPARLRSISSRIRAFRFRPGRAPISSRRAAG
jgi:hypothetical protein